MGSSVVLVELPGLLRDLLSAELEGDPELRLVTADEAARFESVVVVGVADSPLERVLTELQARACNVRAVIIADWPLPGDVFRFEMQRVGSNVSPPELVMAVRAAAAQGRSKGKGIEPEKN